MDCGQIQSLFTAYQDGELDQRNLLPFERHLAACPHCAREWQDFRKTLRMLQGVKPLPVPPDLLSGIHGKLAGAGFGARLGRALGKIFTPVPLTAAASLIAAALAVSVVIKTHTVSNPKVPDAALSRTAQTEMVSSRTPPLATLPVSLDLPATRAPLWSPQLLGSERNSYYRSLLEHEGAEISLLAHFLPMENPAASTSAPGWQLGAPLVPDVTIRVHHLSPEGMKWLHDRIKKEGRWQTHLYSRDFFVVLVEPGDLPALYNLLQRQHLPFSSHSLQKTERARKTLLVAVRPR